MCRTRESTVQGGHLEFCVLEGYCAGVGQSLFSIQLRCCSWHSPVASSTRVRRGSSSLSISSQLSNVFPLHNCSFISADIHPSYHIFISVSKTQCALPLCDFLVLKLSSFPGLEKCFIVRTCIKFMNILTSWHKGMVLKQGLVI